MSYDTPAQGHTVIYTRDGLFELFRAFEAQSLQAQGTQGHQPPRLSLVSHGGSAKIDFRLAHS